LQVTHVGTQGGLIAHRRRHPTEQSGYFRTGLHKPEDVVDEQQHVLLVHIAEVLGHGQSRQTHPHPGTGGLVHLTVNQSHFRLAQVVGVDHAGLNEFVVEVVPFAGPLTHTAEHRHTTVLFGDVVDQLLNQNGFAHTQHHRTDRPYRLDDREPAGRSP
jgi:hypothetical protein